MIQPTATPSRRRSEAALRVERALALRHHQRAQLHRRITPYGVILFLIAVLIAGSAFRALRFEVGGLLLHPYLIPMTALAIFVGLPKLNQFPRFSLQALMAFLVLFAFSTLPAGGDLGEMAKLIASALTVITAALVVRSRKDLLAAVLGLSCAATLLAVRGLTSGAGLEGINPLEEVANKNAFSLYALPPILLACFLAMEKETPRWLRWAFASLSALTVVAIFSSANRSGWLGVVAIAVLLYSRRHRLRATLFLAGLGLLSYLLLTQYSTTEVLENRWEETVSSADTGTLRRDLFLESLQVGLEHPILGVSPQQLPTELAYRLQFRAPAVDPHNALGYLIGGSGIPTTLMLFAFAWSLWHRPRLLRWRHLVSNEARQAHNLLRMLLVLWLLRGMFSREILYSPAFSMGLGLCIGLCLLNDVWNPRALLQRRRETTSAEAQARG